MYEGEPFTQMLGGEGMVYALLGLAAVILFLPKGPEMLGLVLRMAWACTFGLAWWVAKTVGGSLYWYGWKKPRLSRAMWEHEIAARSFWGRAFKARSPIPAAAREKYAPANEEVETAQSVEQGQATLPQVVDVEWETVSTHRGSSRR